VTRYRAGPRPLTLALEDLRDDLAPETLLAEVQRVWPSAVGPAIAAEASPTAERAGVVTISCSASVWTQELDLMSPTILGRLNARRPGAQIKRLRCVTA
jgi:predicted nucleic acid-binding Zn ribbon protein